MGAAGELLGLLRQATPESMERAARLAPVCAGNLSPRQRRAARRLAEQAAVSYRKALDAGEPAAGYDAHGDTVADAGGAHLTLEA